MDPDFWHNRWANNQIGFHEGKPNALLAKHFERLGLAPGAHVFLPLCGKTRDIAWLLDLGFKVTGAELNNLAVEQLFEELGIAPTVTAEGKMTRYSAPFIDIFQGDIFDLSGTMLGQENGKVDAVYDRAALVALPAPMRARYAAHLMDITGTAPQFLIAFDYDQSLVNGPPFSVNAAEVRTHYADAYRITLLDDVPLDGGLKGKFPAQEQAWLLEPS